VRGRGGGGERREEGGEHTKKFLISLSVTGYQFSGTRGSICFNLANSTKKGLSDCLSPVSSLIVLGSGTDIKIHSC
jgi:hypothetical protein